MRSSVDAVGGGVRLQRHVRHPLQRHVVRRVGEGAAVAAGQAEAWGERAVELVADQDPVAHEVPLPGGDAVVVEADRREAVRVGAVAGDVHQRRAVAQAAELVRRGEAGAGVGRLVADRPVVLGGVPDRLVDGQPQVGRVDHQVVPAGFDRRGSGLLGQPLGQPGQLGVPVPPGAGEVLPAPGRRGSERTHGLEPAAVGVDGGGRERRRGAHPLLERGGAGQVGVELVLPHDREPRPRRGPPRRRAAAATGRPATRPSPPGGP